MIRAVNTRYRLERWRLPDGSYREGCLLPDEIKGYHFGATLRSFIDYQYHHQGVTQLLFVRSIERIWSGDSCWRGEPITHRKERYFSSGKREKYYRWVFRRLVIFTWTILERDIKGKTDIAPILGMNYLRGFPVIGIKAELIFCSYCKWGDQKYRVNTDGLNYMKTHQLPGIPFNLLRVISKLTYGID